jgi:hypothetical protein
MDLASLCTMQQEIKCRIELLSTFYFHLDDIQVAKFALVNPARANGIPGACLEH